MRIFFVISRMDRGGAQKVALNFLNFMCRYTNHDVYLILFNLQNNDSYMKNLSSKCKIINLNKTAKFGWLSLAFKIRDLQPDIIISTINYINISTLVAVLLSNTNAKIIIREAIPLSTVSYLILKLQSILYWRANHFWAITPVIASELNELISIPKRIISIIPNPVDLDYIDLVSNKTKNNNLNNKLKILYVGRLIKRKGVDSLIKSLSFVESDSWELKIIGDGSENFALKELSRSLNLSDKIEFIPFSENPYEFFLTSDLFCLPSWFEGLPNVVIESLVCGNHCLANDTEGGGVKFIKSLVNSLEIVDFNNHKKVAEIINFYISNPIEIKRKKNLALQARNVFNVKAVYINFIEKMFEKN